jgi:hypothetical protein
VAFVTEALVEPKTTDLGDEIAIKEDVGWAEVPMNNGFGPSLVDIAHGGANLGCNANAVIPF